MQNYGLEPVARGGDRGKVEYRKRDVTSSSDVRKRICDLPNSLILLFHNLSKVTLKYGIVTRSSYVSSDVIATITQRHGLCYTIQRRPTGNL